MIINNTSQVKHRAVLIFKNRATQQSIANIYKTLYSVNHMDKKTGDNSNSSGIASVVFGILGLIFPLTIILGSFAGMILSILSLIFALVQRKHFSNKWSTAGIILSILGIIINLIIIIWLINLISNYIVPAFQQAVEQAQQLQGYSQYASP